jgi:hypothetical protein
MLKLGRPDAMVPPDRARLYLGVLDDRILKLKRALTAADGGRPLVADPKRVVHIGYFVPDRDEADTVCGSQPGTVTRGLDVLKDLRFAVARLSAVGSLMRNDLFPAMRCMADRASCTKALPPGGAPYALGSGTGFSFVDGFQPVFARHGLCALATGDGEAVQAERHRSLMPRWLVGPSIGWQVPRGNGFGPGWDPSDFWPYDPARRWLVTPNDAYLRANTFNDNWPLSDRFQPLYAATYSGGFHPNAQGHAFMADYVYCQARRVLADELGPAPPRCVRLPAAAP